MEKKKLQDAQRYNDPLGDHVRKATDLWQRRLERYPKVETVYNAKYIRFFPLDKNGALFLSGSEGIVGSELFIRPLDDVRPTAKPAGSSPAKTVGPNTAIGANMAASVDAAASASGALGAAGSVGACPVDAGSADGRALGIFSYSGRCLAKLEDTVIQELILDGWKLRCFLAHTIYNSDQKSFMACCACFCYSPELDAGSVAALETFIKHIVERVALRSYPRLDLTQEQLARVIDSKGEWFLTKEQPWPELPKGSLYYRRRRTFNDRLIATALSGNKGCIVVSWVGMILLLIAVVLLIVWLLWLR